MKKIKIIAILLIVIGLGILLFSVISKYITMKNQDNLIKDYEKKIEDVQKTTTENPKSDDEEISGTIGILVIDKINLKVAVSEGTDMDTLKYAVGHFKETAMPGEKGNFALAGHRNYTFGEYFNRLDELENGDEITMKTTKGSFTYKVYGKKVVLPEQVEVLNPTKEATMTLITCTPVRVATHRLIINAKLIN